MASNPFFKNRLYSTSGIKLPSSVQIAKINPDVNLNQNLDLAESMADKKAPTTGNKHPSIWTDILGVVGSPISLVESAAGAAGQAAAGKSFGGTFMKDMKSQFTDTPYGGYNMWEQITNKKTSMDKLNPVLKGIIGIGTDLTIGAAEMGIGEISGISGIARASAKFAGGVVKNVTSKLISVASTNAGVRGTVARSLTNISDDLKVKFSPFYKMSDETKQAIEGTQQAVNMNRKLIEHCDKEYMNAKSNYVNQILTGTETPELKTLLDSDFHKANPMISKKYLAKAKDGTITTQESNLLKSQSNSFIDAIASHAYQVRSNRNLSVADVSRKLEKANSDDFTKTSRLILPVSYGDDGAKFNKEFQETLSNVMGKSEDKDFIKEVEPNKHQILFRQSKKTDELPVDEDGNPKKSYNTENSIDRISAITKQYEKIKNHLSNAKTQEEVSEGSKEPLRKVGMTGLDQSNLSTKLNTFLERSGLSQEDGVKYHYNNMPTYKRDLSLQDARKTDTKLRGLSKRLTTKENVSNFKELKGQYDDFVTKYKPQLEEVSHSIRVKQFALKKEVTRINDSAELQKEDLMRSSYLNAYTPNDEKELITKLGKENNRNLKAIKGKGYLRAHNGKLYFIKSKEKMSLVELRKPLNDNYTEWSKLSPSEQDDIMNSLPKAYKIKRTSKNISKEEQLVLKDKIETGNKKIESAQKKEIKELEGRYSKEIDTMASPIVDDMEEHFKDYDLKAPNSRLGTQSKFAKYESVVDGLNKNINDFGKHFSQMEMYNSAKWFVHSMEKNHVLPTGAFGNISKESHQLVRDLLDPLDRKSSAFNNHLYSLTNKGKPLPNEPIFDSAYLPNQYSDQFKQQELDANRYVSNTDNLANSMLMNEKTRIGTAAEVSDSFGMKVANADHETVSLGMDTNVMKQIEQICRVKSENFALSSILTSSLDNQEIRMMTIAEQKSYHLYKSAKVLPKGYTNLHYNDFTTYMDRASKNKFLSDTEKDRLTDIDEHINTMFAKANEASGLSEEEFASNIENTGSKTKKSNLIINSQLKQMLDQMVSPPDLSYLKQSLLKLNSAWKKWTIFHPSYYVHILGGNFMNSVSAGKNPVLWTRYFTKNVMRTRRIEKLWGSTVPDILKDNLAVGMSQSGFIDLVSSKLEGADKEAWDFWHKAYNNGLTHLNTGRVNATTSSYTEALQASMKPNTSAMKDFFNKVSTQSMRMTNYIDDSSRAAIYEMTLNNPKSSLFYKDKIGLWDNDKIAAEEAKMVHFDYSRLTPFESTSSFRTLIPFYSWWKQNLNLQLNLLLSPISAKIKQELGSWQSDFGAMNANGMSKFDFQSGYLPIWKTDNNVAVLKLTPPSNDLQYLVSGNTLGRISPFIQASYNAFTGKDLSTGYTETRRASTLNLLTPGLLGAANRMIGQSIINHFASKPKKYAQMKTEASKWGVYLSATKKTALEEAFSGMVKLDNYKSNMEAYFKTQLAWYEKELKAEGKLSVTELKEMEDKNPVHSVFRTSLSSKNKLLK